MVNLGSHIQQVLRRSFCLRRNKDRLVQLLRRSGMFMEREKWVGSKFKTLSQTCFAKGQASSKWSVFSSSFNHSGHLDGPSQPILLNCSLVKILLCASVQVNMSILGIETKDQIVLQGVGSSRTCKNSWKDLYPAADEYLLEDEPHPLFSLADALMGDFPWRKSSKYLASASILTG